MVTSSSYCFCVDQNPHTSDMFLEADFFSPFVFLWELAGGECTNHLPISPPQPSQARPDPHYFRGQCCLSANSSGGNSTAPPPIQPPTTTARAEKERDNGQKKGRDSTNEKKTFIILPVSRKPSLGLSNMA